MDWRVFAVVQYPLQHWVFARLVLVPRQNDFLVRADKVFPTLHESVELYRVANRPTRIGKRHLASFLVTVGLLADLLSDQGSICLITKMSRVGHGCRKGVGTNQNEEVSFAVDIRQVANRMYKVFQTLLIVATPIQAQIYDELIGMLLFDQIEKSLAVLAQISVATETAVNRMSIAQIGVPEVFIGSLLEQRGLFEGVSPLNL